MRETKSRYEKRSLRFVDLNTNQHVTFAAKEVEDRSGDVLYFVGCPVWINEYIGR